MKESLPDTYIEVLTYLKEQPNGLSTAELFSKAKERRYHGFKEAGIISGIINRLREKKLVTTSSSGSGGKNIHVITPLGLTAFADESAGPENASDPPSPKTIAADADTIISKIQASAPEEKSSGANQSDKYRDFQAEFDSGMQLIRRAILDALIESKTITIQNKRLKLSVLEKLEPMYNDEISGVLAGIRSDIEQLEGE